MMTEPNIIPVGQEPSPMRTPADQERRRERRTLRAASSPKPGKPKGRTAAGGRFRSVNAFADFTMRDLTRNEIAVWLILWRDSRDGVACVSQESIAERAGIASRTVRRAVDRLRARGLLTVVHRGSLQRGPSSYRVRALRREGGTAG